jgi:hypothetical protein
VSGRREEEADRAPERGPEDRRHDDRERRQPGAGAVEPGLDHVVADELGHEEEATTQSSIDQPGSTATASAIGNRAARNGPR